jgi:hypothetical protein
MIQAIISESGLADAMRYWLLLELLCSEFKKDTTEFIFSTRQLQDALHIKFTKKLTTFAQLLTNFSTTFDQKSLNFCQLSDNFWKIETRIILDLMGKDFKRTRLKSGNATPKNKEERIKKKEYICVSDFSDDLKKIYAGYPRKEGTKVGMARLKKQIKNLDDLNRFRQAVENYTDMVKSENRERKHIKQFSAFTNCWEDYIEKPTTTLSAVEDDMRKLLGPASYDL